MASSQLKRVPSVLQGRLSCSHPGSGFWQSVLGYDTKKNKRERKRSPFINLVPPLSTPCSQDQFTISASLDDARSWSQKCGWSVSIAHVDRKARKLLSSKDHPKTSFKRCQFLFNPTERFNLSNALLSPNTVTTTEGWVSSVSSFCGNL